jgi:hypothetical protein
MIKAKGIPIPKRIASWILTLCIDLSPPLALKKSQIPTNIPAPAHMKDIIDKIINKTNPHHTVLADLNFISRPI